MDKQWESFYKNTFRKYPCVIKRALKSPLASSQDILDTLKAAGDQYRHPPESLPASPNLYTFDKKNRDISVLECLPNNGTKSLPQYEKTLRRIFEGREFGIIINQVQSLNFNLWNRSRYFLKELFEEAGFPPGFMNLALFVARYKASPTGLHKDSVDVFCHVMTGKKTIRLWPFEKFFGQSLELASPTNEVSLKHINYSKFLDESIVLVGEPGDIIYWPRHYWHVGEGNPRETTVTLNQTINFHDDLWLGVSDKIGPLLEKQMRGQPNTKNGRIVRRKFDALLKEATLREKLSRKTGFGFRYPPPLKGDVSFHESEVWGSSLDFPIEIRKSGRDLLVAACGHVLTYKDSRVLRTLFSSLKSTKKVRVSRLRQNWDVDEFNFVFSDLIRHRFIYRR